MNKIAVRADNISKQFRLKNVTIEAVRQVSFSIKKGEIVSIIGKSGSGKSTLMHIIGALSTPTKGRVWVDGVDISKMSSEQRAKLRNKKIGFVFQQFNLLQRTSALDNVILPLKYSDIPKGQWRERAEKMLKIVGLEERMENKPNELSGGQQQRVAIARALVTDPAIILADEPTGNLDSKTGKEIITLFKDLNKKGKTVIIVTHDADIANATERKLMLKDGKMI